jgi:hypothetical protein
MRVWFVTVTLLFLLVQFYQWLRGFMLPLPVYVMAGAFLAIASNYEKGLTAFLPIVTLPQENDILNQTASLIEDQKALAEANDIKSDL